MARAGYFPCVFRRSFWQIPALAVLRVGPKRVACGSLLAALLRSLGAAFAAAGTPPSEDARLGTPPVAPGSEADRARGEASGGGAASPVQRRQLARLLSAEAGAMRELRGHASWNPLLGLFTPLLLPCLLPRGTGHARRGGGDAGGGDHGGCASCSPGRGATLWERELKRTDRRLALCDVAARCVLFGRSYSSRTLRQCSTR